MKITVLNYSGSVGKTVVASHLLAPRMEEAQIIAIESTNETAADLGLDINQLRGEQFSQLFRELMINDNIIVDVGASNIEAFLDYMAKYHGSHEEIDLFVLPVINTGKAQRETIKTITALAMLGVKPEKIRVLFNRVEGDVKEEFLPIFVYAQKTKDCIADPNVVISESDVFELLADHRTTIAEVMNDERDYRQELREADKNNYELISFLADMRSLKLLAIPVNNELNNTYKALVKGIKPQEGQQDE